MGTCRVLQPYSNGPSRLGSELSGLWAHLNWHTQEAIFRAFPELGALNLRVGPHGPQRQQGPQNQEERDVAPALAKRLASVVIITPGFDMGRPCSSQQAVARDQGQMGPQSNPEVRVVINEDEPVDSEEVDEAEELELIENEFAFGAADADDETEEWASATEEGDGAAGASVAKDGDENAKQ